MNDDEIVCMGNDEPSEYSGVKQARQILEQAAALSLFRLQSMHSVMMC